jgi:hypothetical protein
LAVPRKRSTAYTRPTTAVVDLVAPDARRVAGIQGIVARTRPVVPHSHARPPRVRAAARVG